LGCGLSFWRYEGKIIDIDIGGSFLDGISDQIYLLDSGDDCKVWDAEELSGNYSGSPINDYSGSYSSNPTCLANSSYINSQCSCNTGYKTDDTKTYCIKIPSCSEGYYLDTNNQCITYTQGCKSVNNNDPKIIGTKGVDGKISCYCIDGFIWNGSQCITNSAPIKTEELKPISDEIKVSKPIESKPIPPKIDDSKIIILDKEIEAKLKVAGTLRDCPSTSCKVVRYYAESAVVQIIGNYNNKEWFKVKAKDDGKLLEGWMHNSVLETTNESAESKEIKSATTTAENVSNNKNNSWVKKLWQFILNFGA
jgi:hypothetical protein